MVAPVDKTPILNDGEYTVEKVVELSFFDLMGKSAGTHGTSNKSYHAELQCAIGDGTAQIFTMWGPTGGTQTKEWRHYGSTKDADKDFAAIIKSKTKKGYVEIDVAQRAYGSDAAKQITKAVVLTNADAVVPVGKVSKLATATQNLISHLFGATSQFVATTLKCPLGQLTNKQIDEGRTRLNDAKIILNNPNASKKEINRLQDLTNEFYALIPHNLGSGARGQMTQLLLDDINKVVNKEQDLDTLLDAKSIGAVLNKDSGIDAQYEQLNADLTLVDPTDPIFSFMSSYFEKSKVRNHGYDKAKVKNLWKMDRKDKESDFFLTNAERIGEECGKHIFAKEASPLYREAESWVPNKRPDLDSKLCNVFNKSNTWLCWHGTRSANVVGITKRGLLIRPAGAIHTGSMFGDGKYFAHQSTKSLNYTDGGYWTGGRNQNSSRFMFLLDVAFGNMHIASGPSYYSKAPKGYHCVYGKAHKSGVMNDEMITYDFNQRDTQSRIRYLFEITD